MFKNMKIMNKLILAFITIAVIASISGIISVVTLTQTNQEYSDALENYGFAQGDIGKAMMMIIDNRRAVRDVVNYDEMENIMEAKETLDRNREQYNLYAANIEKSLTTDEAKKLYSEIQNELVKYREVQDMFVDLGIQSTPEERKVLRERMIAELDPVYQNLYDSYVQLMNFKVDVGSALSEELDKQGVTSIVIIVVLMIIAMAASVIFGILIARGIANPVADCAGRLQKLAQGDLKTPVPEFNSNDEAGLLADSTMSIVTTVSNIIYDMGAILGEFAKGNFNMRTTDEGLYVGDFSQLITFMRTIAVNLSETMGQIGEVSDQVASGADQVSDGAQALSQGATEQASSIEELSATINEIYTNIKKNAEYAIDAKVQSEEAAVEIMDSNRQMKEMISAMNDISEKSDEIGKIIKTIDDIAFQTNILALNAAVEAARAGEAGKGFAVVADEVRNLAGKSAEAAKNTAILIEESIQSVANGTKMADSAAKAILGIVDGAKAVAGLVEEIASASDEQAKAVSQVTQGVEQISSVVQTNSATAEESAAASEELSGQAQNLKELIRKLKLRREDS